MNPRERLEKELRRFTKEQLAALVFSALDEKLEDFAIASSLEAIIFQFMEQLLLQDKKMLSFLLFMKELNKPDLTGAINDFLPVILGRPVPQSDPYSELVVFGEPFVDRQDLRLKLKSLFTTQNGPQVLVTRGPRYSGRSHLRWLIQYVAQKEGIEAVYIDLLGNNVNDIIGQIINELGLPAAEFRDRLAQESTQAKGFRSAFRGKAREFPAKNQRWCLVFDHHDRDEVVQDARALVEMLVDDGAAKSLANVWVVVLGHGTMLSPQLTYRILDVPTVPLEPVDVEKFLGELFSRQQQQLTVDELAGKKAEIFLNLTTPLSLEGMYTMAERIRKCIY